MVACEIKAEYWPYKLASVLTGKAQHAGMATADAGNYHKLKEAVFDVSEESYRQKFRCLKRKGGESN